MKGYPSAECLGLSGQASGLPNSQRWTSEPGRLGHWGLIPDRPVLNNAGSLRGMRSYSSPQENRQDELAGSRIHRNRRRERVHGTQDRPDPCRIHRHGHICGQHLGRPTQRRHRRSALRNRLRQRRGKRDLLCPHHHGLPRHCRRRIVGRPQGLDDPPDGLGGQTGRRSAGNSRRRGDLSRGHHGNGEPDLQLRDRRRGCGQGP